MTVIKAENLTKEFKIAKKGNGLSAAFKNLLVNEKTIVTAVNGVSFDIGRGEIVGYIGPNGAGKSTTIKMMCGILTPTRGSIHINGISPTQHRQKVVKDLGVVFGQRSQLYWDLRLGESFELLRRIYMVSNDKFNANMEELNDILQFNDFIDTPVRQLSLGQRMRADLAAAMLHSPSVLFLDEPTIGLDVDAKYAVRKFIKKINERSQITIILTTHDLDDIQTLCKRIIIINNGVIISDCSLDELIDKELTYRLLFAETKDGYRGYTNPKAEVTVISETKLQLKFRKSDISAAELISDLSKHVDIADVQIKESDIDDVIRQIFARSKN